MRPFKLTLFSLVLLLLPCAPALAQGSPTYSQYGVQTGSFCPAGTADDQAGGPGESQIQSACDVPPAAADNVGQGTSAVNDALAEPASATSASASGAASASAAGTVAGSTAEEEDATGSPGTGVSEADGVATGNPKDADVTQGEGLASITELPETGGAFPPSLGAGMLLVAVGLAIRRIINP